MQGLLGFEKRVKITFFVHDRSTVNVTESGCAQCSVQIVPNLHLPSAEHLLESVRGRF